MAEGMQRAALMAAKHRQCSYPVVHKGRSSSSPRHGWRGSSFHRVTGVMPLFNWMEESEWAARRRALQVLVS